MLDAHFRRNMATKNDNVLPRNGTDSDLGFPVKTEGMYEVCEGCGSKIQDRFFMKVSDSVWHERCLSCTVCGLLLTHSCFFRNNKFYCKADYDRLFGVKCTRCGDRILPQEMVMKAQNHVYHLTCFMCIICCKPLQKGEQYFLRGGQLFCKQDFEKEVFLYQHSVSPENFIMDETCRRDGRRGPKRPRTILTSVQRRQFKASFEVSPKPCRKVREALAKDTGLSVRVVQVWFQNQRAKMKKIQRKAKQDTDKNADKGDKRDPDIKQEPISDRKHYIMSMPHDRDDNSYTGSHPLNPNNPYSPEGTYGDHSTESFCSSDVSLDESANMEEVGSDTLSLDLSVATRNHDNGMHHHHNPMLTQVNPIDKLYLMQNSYFNSNEQ